MFLNLNLNIQYKSLTKDKDVIEMRCLSVAFVECWIVLQK